MTTLTELNERRGSSGAVIHVLGEKTLKLDTKQTGGRVLEQGIWLQASLLNCVPRVTRILSNGYEMETLAPVDIFGDLTTRELLNVVVTTWNDTRSPRRGNPTDLFVAFDHGALLDYVLKICRQLALPHLGLTLVRSLLNFKVPNHHTGGEWTHGDPIVDNLMMRPKTNEFILIDAIPPTPALPSHPMVDWGRFVQSAAGYELIRYRGEFPDDATWRDDVHEILNTVAHKPFTYRFCNEAARAAVTYGVIHMLRGVRSAALGSDARIMLAVQAQALAEEFDVWMR